LSTLGVALRGPCPRSGHERGEIVDVRPCDPVNTRTTRQLVCCFLRDDRRARTSTAAPFLVLPNPGATPELACHPRVVPSQPFLP
jgi:hypothetical protein